MAEQDARDRESPLIRRALEREQVGDLDGAIQNYEDALLETPKLASAHFHLALLQQDYRKDYISAIYHYQQYEHLRPNSEKKTLLRDRTRVCQQLLGTQLFNNGDVAISHKQLELAAEIDKLNKRLSLIEGEKAALLEQKNGLDKLLTEQKIENERIRRLLDRVIPAGSTTTTEEPHPRSVLPRLDPGSTTTPTPPPPRITIPEPAPEPVVAKPVVAKPAVQPVAIEPLPQLKVPTDTENSAHPATQPITSATRTCVAQPGDTVWSIAERVYGNADQWKKIRDANKDHLGPGNQIRAGQVLVIP